MKKIITLVVSMCCLACLQAWSQDNQLKAGFEAPPHWSRPQVWWHWMNGNVSKQGIRNDLLWMKRAGIGGIHIFDAGLRTPQVVKERVTFMSPAWNSCMKYAVDLADSLGIDVALTSVPGWSNTGGPWVEPQDAMKKIVWREMTINGGRRVKAQLPAPFTISGPYQNLPVDLRTYDNTTYKAVADYYRDICVLAVPMSDADLSMQEMGAKITSSGGNFTLRQLTDGDIAHAETLPADTTNGSQWIEVAFDRPRTIKALSIGGGKRWPTYTVNEPRPTRFLYKSNDGKLYTRVCTIPISQSPLQTINIPATTARYFRVEFRNQKTPIEVSELCLYKINKVEHAADKAGFGTPSNLSKYVTKSGDPQPRLSQIIDVTSFLKPDGTLNWRAPEGRWRILRIGYSLVGSRNYPASPEAMGLEVDKMDSAAVVRYMNSLINIYRNAVGSAIGDGKVGGMMFDSYEVGRATWTPSMPEEFERRRGYKLLPWMPALTGEIVESPEKTEQFLFDWRKTLAELIADNLYKTAGAIANAAGMKTFMEAHEMSRAFVGDGMDVKKNADTPMGAMWADPRLLQFNDNALCGSQSDIHESASVANLWGRRRVAAESLTASGEAAGGLAYTFHPAVLKRVVDLEFANGLNQVVIHESAHQPVEDKRPGLGLLNFGQWFTRFETWAERAKPWTDYLSRTSYMLSQGRQVVDVLWYYPDDTNVSAYFNNKLPAVPPTNSFDYLNTTALTELLEYDGNEYKVPSGMTYKLLVIDPRVGSLTVKALRKIAALVRKGAPLCAQRPGKCPSLADSKQEWNSLVADIWGKNRPNVFTDKNVAGVLKRLRVAPDFVTDTMDSLRFVHRSTPTAEIYWVNNRSFSPRGFTARFNVYGLKPTLWHPETGKTEEMSYRVDDSGAAADLNLQPGEAVFVVFQEPVDHHAIQVLTRDTTTEMMNVGGKWTVRFEEGLGAPKEITTNELKSYAESSNPGIRYFGGTAVYSNAFRLDRLPKSGQRVVLDLGSVYYIASVKVNGNELGTIWQPPYAADITDALRKGDNRLEIEVISLWRNRVIGDQQKDCTHKYTYTPYPFYNADSKLIPAGLVGPVKLFLRKQKAATR